MRDTELELELEDLMNVLAESDLESEAAWEAEHDQKIPALRCTTVGKRVGSFVCSPWDLARIIGFLGVPVSPNVLQAAVEAAAGAAVSLATTAAASLDLLNRTMHQEWNSARLLESLQISSLPGEPLNRALSTGKIWESW